MSASFPTQIVFDDSVERQCASRWSFGVDWQRRHTADSGQTFMIPTIEPGPDIAPYHDRHPRPWRLGRLAGSIGFFEVVDQAARGQHADRQTNGLRGTLKICWPSESNTAIVLRSSDSATAWLEARIWPCMRRRQKDAGASSDNSFSSGHIRCRSTRKSGGWLRTAHQPGLALAFSRYAARTLSRPLILAS